VSFKATILRRRAPAWLARRQGARRAEDYARQRGPHVALPRCRTRRPRVDSANSDASRGHSRTSRHSADPPLAPRRTARGRRPRIASPKTVTRNDHDPTPPTRTTSGLLRARSHYAPKALPHSQWNGAMSRVRKAGPATPAAKWKLRTRRNWASSPPEVVFRVSRPV